MSQNKKETGNRIMVLCSGNTCRSPMAEGIIRDIMRRNHLTDLSVTSAGLAAYYGDPPSDYAVEVLKEIGIDIREHRSRPAYLEEVSASDVIYVMTPQHKNVLVDADPTLEPRIIVMDIADPFGLSIEAYRECRDKMLAYFKRELTGEEA